MADLSNPIEVELAPRHPVGLKLANPVMIASGTLGYDGYGRGLIGKYPVQELGAVIPKTVTRQPREGNPEPRWFPDSYRVAWDEGDHLFLNAIGLINPGIETAVHEWTPRMGPVGCNGGLQFCSPQRRRVRRDGEPSPMTTVGISALELNLSCPNIENGAMFSYSAATDTATRLRPSRPTPICPCWPSCLPTFPDITEIALAAVDGGARRPDHLQHPSCHAHRPHKRDAPCSATSPAGCRAWASARCPWLWSTRSPGPCGKQGRTSPSSA